MQAGNSKEAGRQACEPPAWAQLLLHVLGSERIHWWSFEILGPTNLQCVVVSAAMAVEGRGWEAVLVLPGRRLVFLLVIDAPVFHGQPHP
jgi:hypothetical protein